MKILHLAHGRSFTGPAAAALADVRAILAAGGQAWLAGRSGTAIETGCAAHGIPFFSGLYLERGPAQLLRLPDDVQRLRAIVAQHEIEVVHVHRSTEQLLVRLAFGGAPRPALARSWHRDPAALASPLLRGFLNGVAASCCVARAHEETLRQCGARAARFIPAGVDTRRFRPDAAGLEPRGVGRPAVLGLIGRWKQGEDRGQRAFLEVARRLDRALPWRGRLLGRGEDRPQLEALLSAHPARERLALEETDRDFAAQVARLDLGLVFAVGSDGASRPAVECLASGVPLLVADRPGLRELGDHAPCVRVLPLAEYDEWREAAEALLRQPGELAALRPRTRACAEAEHALAVRGARLLALYGEALNGGA